LEEEQTYDEGGYDDGGGMGGLMAAEAGGAGEWSEYFDDESGSPYWYNETTGESSYTNPYDAAAADAAIVADGYGAEAYPSEGYDDAGGGEWSEQYDDDGNVYWYNNTTGASSYEDPNGGAGEYDDQSYAGYDEGGYGESYEY
jgi:hypothetical protein